MSIVIRPLEINDIEAASILLKSAWMEFASRTEFVATTRFNNSDSHAWLRAHIEGGGYGFAAFDDDNICGVITVSVRSSTIEFCDRHLYIHDVVVAESARRQGVGEMLERAVERLARDLDIHLVMGDVWAYNSASRTMMMKLGRRMMYEVWGKKLP